MTRRAIVGIQFGDEGKAKIIGSILTYRDRFFGNYGPVTVARHQGGGNAGHTQYVTLDSGDESVVFHLIPSGTFFPGTYNLIIPETVIEPIFLVEELESVGKKITSKGCQISPENFGISGRVQMTLGYHLEIEANEVRKRGGRIAPTLRGIMPTYMDMAARRGITFAEFLNAASFSSLLDENLERASWDLAEIYNMAGSDGVVLPDTQMRRRVKIDKDALMAKYERAREVLGPFHISDRKAMALLDTGNVLFEGAQGVGIDRDYGRRPDNTSSCPVRLPRNADKIGVAKSFISRVGADDPPTRLPPDIEELIRGNRGEEGAEFGSTTGRPRSMGWPDIPVTRYGAEMAGVDSIAVTHFDKLPRVPGRLKICDYYLIDGERVDEPPADQTQWKRIEPHCIEVDGFPGEDFSHARDLSDLSTRARDYLSLIQDLVGKPISMVSVGPRNEQTIFV